MRLSPGMLITMKGSTVQWEVLPEAKWLWHDQASVVCIIPGQHRSPGGYIGASWKVGDISFFPADLEETQDDDFEIDSFEHWVSQVRKEAGIVDE